MNSLFVLLRNLFLDFQVITKTRFCDDESRHIADHEIYSSGHNW